MAHAALKLALAPVLLAQGLATRARMPRLPEPEGARDGEVGEVGERPPLALLLAGDSSAAGVGVAHQRDALAQPLASLLATRMSCGVRWRLLARTSLDTEETLALLQAQPQVRTDLAVIVTGVNNVTGRVPVQRALDARAAIVRFLQDTAGARHVAFAPLPPLHAFPGLPQPLRRIAGAEASRHDEALRDWCAAQEGVSLVPMSLPLDPAAMARDGFHPGADAYRWMAQAIAEHLASRPAVEAALR